MTPGEGSLTEWAKLEVQRMIDATIEKYDQKQEARHKENSVKLDKITDIVAQAHGSGRLIAWAIPIIVAILTVIAEIIRK